MPPTSLRRPGLTSLLLLWIAAHVWGCSESFEVDALDGGPLPIDGGSVMDSTVGMEAGHNDAGGKDLYLPEHMLEVDLTLAPADWDRIRGEGRSINQSFSGCKDRAFEYTFVPATATVDGVTVERVGLRKKGYLGSISQVKPSLRLDFAEYDGSKTLHGQKDLTLNNSRSDSSLLHQCLSYRVFAAAGIPAPRCSFARVRANGQELGIYVNVEPIKKPLLRRFYRNDDGNLYEGNSAADFRPGHIDFFEKKTNESNPDRSELERIRVALESEGAEMLAKLEPLVDLDQFLRYWAVETIVGHWDSFAGNLNNFFIYYDQTTGKVTFIPWGTDDSFSKTHTFLPSGQRPVATYAYSRLPHRLYAYEATRRRYHQVLREVLDAVWDESALLAEVDRMAALVGDAANPRALSSLRSFIATRRADIERELAAPDTPWTLGERQLRACRPEMITDVRGTFATTWGGPEVVNEYGALELSLSGQPQSFVSVATGAGASLVSVLLGTGPTLRLIGTREDGSTITVQFGLGAAPPTGPGELRMHGFETYGLVLSGGGPTGFGQLGYIGEGKIDFQIASNFPGAPVIGYFEGKFVQTRGAEAPQ